MTTYLVNFILCSALLLLAYRLLLYNKAIYQYNRIYLLLSILFSLGVPLVVVHHAIAPLPSVSTTQVQLLDYVYIGEGPSSASSPIDYYFYTGAIIYGAVTFLLLCRFIRNLYSIRLMVLRNESIDYQHARLILIDENMIPHTFLNYIFLNKAEYEAGQVEEAVLEHELAHARQFHSIDIIFIELMQAIFWFNPFLILYRRAIQLNHEFIADDAALARDHDRTAYQSLLISKMEQLKSLNITSRFNYSVTKKRLIMMTKTTSGATALLTKLTIIPLMAVAFMLFCSKTEGQETAPNAKSSTVKIPGRSEAAVALQPTKNGTVHFGRAAYPSTKEGLSESQLNEYKAIENKYVTGPPNRPKVSQAIRKVERARMEQLFKQMTHKQQQQQIIGFTYPAGPLPQASPTNAQLNEWKEKMYGVWIDDKHIKNTALKNYRPGDFRQVFLSKLTPIAVKNDGFRYQVDLMTAAYYKKYLKDVIANRFSSHLYYRYWKYANKKG